MAVKIIKVNDRLLFDNTGTGGDGVSAVVSQVQGVTANSLQNVYATASADGNNLYYGRVTTASPHLLQVGDSVTVSATDNSYSRSLTTKVINGNYHFSYFTLVSMKLTTEWASGTVYENGDLVYVANRVYEAQFPAGTSGSSQPTHKVVVQLTEQ